jgi:NAD(P)-dependent dehydrogenase (short-subunit alcohol dehydrogenase family)/acyl dehydratase
MAEPVIRFSEQDLELFSEASGDRNPLHMSRSYASRTAYGEQVVFGALGALGCLGSANLRAGERISELTCDFQRPLFLDVDYRVKISEADGVRQARLMDGTVPLLTVSLALVTACEMDRATNDGAALFERREAAERKESEIGVGMKVAGRYRADASKLELLCERWGIRTDRFAVETLLCGSYVVGMEIPGLRALFFRLALKLEGDPSPGPLAYEATVSKLTPQIGQLRVGVRLSSEGRQVASGHFISFIRAEIEEIGAKVSAASGSGAFEGKVAVVIGGSRGLGAAITAAMAVEGAQVIATSRSEGVDFGRLAPSDAVRRIRQERGDAGDTEWLVKLREQVIAAHGRVDILVANAFPSILALRLEPAAFSRIQAYLNRATALVVAPLCSFLEVLNESDGCAVVISSMAAEQPVREWPHYVAAKRAIEGFATVAPLQYPRTSALIVRPERLLTELINTPMGRQKAAPPEQMANEIIERLKNPLRPGTTEIVRSGGGLKQLKEKS